jgi:SdrD B-like protein
MRRTKTADDARLAELTGKENVPNNWKLGAHAAGVKPPKDNIITAWSEVEPQAAATFLYLAFQREGHVGTTFLTFELNQIKGEWENEAGSTIPCRTTGDVLISYEVSGGSIGEVVVQEWISTATKSVVIEGKSVNCGTEGELKGGAVKVEPAAGVQGAMNTEEITNFLPDPANGSPATIETNNFGEAALNLIEVLKEAKINPCFDFGQIWMHTRSSLSATSELHDYIAPVPLLVQSCSISGRKFDDVNGNKKHDPSESYLEGWKFQLLNATTKAVVQEATTDSEGNYTFTKVEPGTYIVQEVGQSGWTCDVPGEGKACQYEVTIDSEHLNVTERDFGNVPTSKVTTSQEPKSGVVGSKFGDSATVEGPATGGALTPTGEVEFTLYSDNKCETAVAGPIKVTLSGGKASIPIESKVTLSTTGTYYWVATYGGDTNNAKAVSGCADEPVTVEKAKPSIATTPSGSVTVGEKIKDSATLKGLVEATGAGKVTFKLYSDAKCETEVTHFESTGISGSGEKTVSSGEFPTTAAGTYYWIATYPGDANNEEAKTKCGDETVVVTKAKPSIATTPSGSVTVGETIKDSATLKGLVEATGVGKVTFKLYSDAKCETELTHFESTGISGSGEKTVNSGEYKTTAAGTYYWIATYPGDANNEPAATKCGDETVVVKKAQPAIVTKALSPVTVGEAIHDTATLSSLVEPTGAGTVTFKLYSDESCTNEVFKSTSAGISANGNVESGEYTTTATGTYYWTAKFSGDANNEPAESGCKAANEASVVNKTKPGITTEATTLVIVGEKIQDTAKLTNLVNATTGTVTFKLFSDSECHNEVAAAKSTSGAVTGSGTIEVSSGQYTTTATGTYFWIAEYSGDGNNSPVTSGCKDTNESTVVNPAEPAIATKAVSSAIVGEAIHDTATIKGLVEPTGEGTVTFKLYSDSGCKTEVFHSISEGITKNGEVESDAYTPTSTGTYYWTAKFSGDTNNVSVESGCEAVNESSTVEKASPSISTKATPSVTVGDKIKDTATLEGLVDQTGEGKVTFKLYSNELCEGKPVFESISGGIGPSLVSSEEFTTTATGTYYWVASYSGDKNNEPTESGCKDAEESSAVGPASPSIVTTPSGTVTVGGKIKDSATLSGLVNATGASNVTFTLYSDSKCEKEVTSFESTGIGGSGEKTVSSGEYTTVATGTYYWIASYPGDSNNKATETKCGDETVVVTSAKPGITTKAVSPVTVGEKIHDTATLTGLVNPDGKGTVTFKAYGDNECKTAPLFESTSAGIAENGDVPSGDYTTTSATPVYWVASYSGDSNNEPAATKCGDTGETSEVEKAQPGITTKAVSPVTVGAPIHDTATLTGLVEPTGTGTVTFKAYGDNECKTKPLFESEKVFDANGEISSDDYTTTSASPVYWVAFYSGDANNEPAATKCGDTGETSEVEKAKPAIVTKAVSPVIVGEVIHDTATVSALVEPTGTGTVTFRLYSDENCSTEVFNSTSAGITANGNVESEGFTPTATGTYYWTAKFSGDANNVVAESGCKAEGESSLVMPAQPSISTKAVSPVTVGEPIHDTAKLEGLVDPTWTGTVTFKAYGDNECKTKPLFESEKAFDANGEVSSDNYTTTSASPVYWVAFYSGDSNNLEAQTHCGDTGETSLVNKAKPTIGTTPSGTVTVGANINDSATLKGLVDATGEGKVTFNLYSDAKCENEVTHFESTAISGTGEVTVPSGEYTTTAAGTYYWIATYPGDTNNEAAATKCGDETVVVNKAAPSVTTALEPSSTIAIDTAAHDSATLTGASANAGGTVDYRYYASEAECETAASAFTGANASGGTDVGSVSVTNGSVPNSLAVTFHNAGSYYWAAFYSGDSNNQAAVSGCDTELLVVNQAKPTIATQLSASPIAIDTAAHDSATLTGASANAGGTVDYRYYASEAECNGAVPELARTNTTTRTNVTGGTDVGTVTVTDGSVPNSPDVTFQNAGTYYWAAIYSGDANNAPAASACDTELLVVNQAKPSISTTASASVVYGGSLHDTAHLTGGSSNLTGKIVFKLYNASDTTCATVLKTVETEVTKGNGDYESPSVTVGVGSYQWVAEYSGDANNVAATTTCNDAAEQASVTEHPGIKVVKEQQIAGSGQPFTTAPLSTTVGQQINYRITVTNTGDVPLALSFSDPRCDAGTITGPTGNLNPDRTLPSGGVAQYFCSHVVQAGDVPQLTNAATVTGQPPSGSPVSGESSVVANVAAQVVKAECTLSESSIVLHGVGGSKRKPFTVSISSLGIKQITFYLDKHKLKTLTQKQAKNGKYTIKIDPRKLSYGAHKVLLRTVMSDAICAKLSRSGVFIHPRPAIPRFTG